MKLLYYPSICFFILFIQYFITYIFSKERDITIIKGNLLSIILASLFLGGILYLSSVFIKNFDNGVLFYMLLSMSLYGYWFILNPLQKVLLSKKHKRNFLIEEDLKNEGLNFRIFFTDKISTNAMATGIVPFYKIIILAKDLKVNLDSSELKAIVYHEIGHHKRKHIFIMYVLNVIILSLYLMGSTVMNEFDFPNKFFEGLSVFLGGALFVLIVYYIPNKIMYFLEYDADSFSAIKNDRKHMISALKSLDELSDGKLTKGNINHPNLEKRIKNLEL
ncbi:M48 family metalloprotease [Aureibaculum sp. 2210JD6-5]|uniref:M48 family metalloprotease n=1 Tax=Aureibaculum sp. 2210JD6-5 TaxID=3103957 RepID=UPI002AAD626A|nr:M48 family metalloprotease [Aureibaculum sp. 2210JD6-5]MDY7396990.1 M48 family metalloprotease [Aureibaculum sp. 2210JD6-5]